LLVQKLLNISSEILFLEHLERSPEVYLFGKSVATECFAFGNDEALGSSI
jgi:hypothetical protein